MNAPLQFAAVASALMGRSNLPTWGPLDDTHGPSSGAILPLPPPPTEEKWRARLAEAKRIKRQMRKARR